MSASEQPSFERDVRPLFRELDVDGMSWLLDLTQREFRILRYFLDHANAVVTREALLHHVWGYDPTVFTRTVDTHVAELRRLRTLLRPGGLVAISTMDVDALVARVLGRNWPWYMQMHLYYFSRRTLSQLVEAAGYEVLEIRRHRRIVRASYLASRLERRLGTLYRPLARVLDRSGLGRRLVTVDLGDIITLVARKRPLNGAERRNGHGAH